MTRRTALTLRRETLAELSADSLALVAAGAPETRYCPTAGLCTVGMLVDEISERFCTLIEIEP